MTFNLLSLPHLALNRVLANMDLNSVINFAICSTSCDNIVKACNLYRKPIKFHMNHIFDFANLVMYFENGSTLFVWVRQFNHLAEDDSNQRILRNEKFLQDYRTDDEYETYWEDILNGTKLLAEFLTNLFQFSLNSIHISKRYGVKKEEFNSLLNWIPSPQFLHVSTLRPPDLTVEEYDEYEEGINDEEKLMRIVNTNKRMEQLELDFGSVCRQVNLDFSNSFYNKLKIEYSHWLTLQNILEMEFIELDVMESELSSEDVNKMLKMWKKGWNPSMQSVTILNEIRFETLKILHQLNANVTNHEENEYEIKRESDGAAARICIVGFNFTMSVQPASSEPPLKRMRI